MTELNDLINAPSSSSLYSSSPCLSLHPSSVLTVGHCDGLPAVKLVGFISAALCRAAEDSAAWVRNTHSQDQDLDQDLHQDLDHNHPLSFQETSRRQLHGEASHWFDAVPSCSPSVQPQSWNNWCVLSSRSNKNYKYLPAHSKTHLVSLTPLH